MNLITMRITDFRMAWIPSVFSGFCPVFLK